MNRQVVAGMLGLALAGCAQDRSVVSRPSQSLSPVEMTSPLPSIHETINQENAQVDVDSVRAGHPLAASESNGQAQRTAVVVAETQPESNPAAPREGVAADMPAAAETPAVVAENTETRGADETAPAAGVGRPAPFRGATGRPRPRANPAQPAPAVVENPAPTDGPTQPEAVAGGRELASPLSAPAETTAAAETNPLPPAREEALPARAATTPEGRVRIHVPSDGQAMTGAEVSPPAGPDAAGQPDASSPPPRQAGRDPLLGPDPEIMPSFGTMPSSPPALKEKTPAEEIPAESPATILPAAEPPAAAVPDSVAAPEIPAAPPVVRLAPPTELAPSAGDVAGVRAESPAASPETAQTPTAAVEPAPVTPAPGPSPTGSPDPLLGPNPELMPKFDLPSYRPPAAPSQDGTPPSVREMVGAAPPPTAAPTPGAESTGPAASPTAVLPIGPAVDPGVVLTTPAPLPAPTEMPAPTQFPSVTVVNPVGPGTPPAAAAIDLRPSTPAPSSPGRDPLLGANPEIMPIVELLPEPSHEKSTVPTAPPGPKREAEPKPAPSPEPQAAASKPAPAPKPAQVVAPVLSETISDPVDLPPLSNPEASHRVAKREFDGFASVPVSAPPDKTRDPEVRPAAGDPTAVRSRVEPRAAFEAGKPAAWVGSEIITLHDLTFAFKQRRKDMAADQQLTPDVKYMMAKSLLNHMVDRAVIVQEARRELKDAKKFQKFMEMADKVFFDDEVPPMLRQSGTANVQELKKVMAERGDSLDELRENFRLEFLSQGYLEQKIGSKIKVDLPELREYYLDHLREFDLPAQVTWRDLVVEVQAHKSRAEARAKAEALLAKLRRGEDFASLVKAESEGPNKSDGGLWNTSPGSYVVPAVNSALETLPIGQISQLIEGPTSYHVVRVEARRQAGPATFAAVQDQVFKAVRRNKVQFESNAFIDKLKKRTVIRTVFDAPSPVTRASAEVVETRNPGPGR